jgi:hypothetical protein
MKLAGDVRMTGQRLSGKPDTLSAGVLRGTRNAGTEAAVDFLHGVASWRDEGSGLEWLG